MKTPPWYVITGGPCSGKTTLVFEFEKRGKSVIPEPARMFIEEQLAAGNTLPEMLKNMKWFVSSILERHIDIEAKASKEISFFLDRGIPDNLAYFRYWGIEVDDATMKVIRDAKYRKVFLLDMLEFSNDEARYETPAQAQEIHKEIGKVYRELGFDVVEVPVLPVSSRADYILERI